MSRMTLLVSNMWGMASRHKQRSVMLQDALRYNEVGPSDPARARVHEYFSYMIQYEHPGERATERTTGRKTGLMTGD